MAFTAFGVGVACALPLPAALASRNGTPPEISVVAAEPDELLVERGDCVLERRLPDGSLGMRVERLDDAGYLVHAPGHGDFLVAADGSLVRCAPAEGAGWLWQRPLFGQVLPLAATLLGHELLHASAVAIDGRVVAFTGRSGAGKTSLAVHLAAGGAELLTDDVLSLECTAGAVVAHPGVPFANVAAEQLQALTPAGRARLGRTIGTSEKVHIELACMPREALPLSRLYFVERGAPVDGVTFEELDAVEPPELLGATFMPHIVTPGRLVTQLHTCAEVARHARSFRMRAPWEVSAAELAGAVERHVAATTA